MQVRVENGSCSISKTDLFVICKLSDFFENKFYDVEI